MTVSGERAARTARLRRAAQPFALRLERSLCLLVMLVRDRRVPWTARAAFLATAAYASCPVCPMPNMQPALAQGASLAILGLGLLLSWWLTPAPVIAERMQQIDSLWHGVVHPFSAATLTRAKEADISPDFLFAYWKYRRLLMAILLLACLMAANLMARDLFGFALAPPDGTEFARWLLAGLGAAILAAVLWETRPAASGRLRFTAAAAIGADHYSRPSRAAPGNRTRGLYDVIGYRRRWQVLALALPRYVSDSAPVVIGGCGRSGTTLLPAILTNHPRVCAGPESTVFSTRITGAEETDRRFGFAPGRTEALQRLSRSQAEFIDLFRCECLRQTGKDLWIEKTPNNVERLKFLFRHFPNARFVHVVRDGRDVVCSLRRQRWMKLKGFDPSSRKAFIRCVDYWVSQVEAGRRQRGDPRYCEIDYADLVLDTAAALRRLTEFLGIEWSDRLLEPELLRGSLIRFDRLSGKDAAALLDRSMLGGWRQELNPEEIAIFKRRAGRLLIELGYEANMDWS